MFAREYPEHAGLTQASELVHWPVAENRLAEDIVFFYRPEVAAGVGHTAVVTQHEVAARRHGDLRVRALVGVSRRHVIFFDGFPVDVDLTGIYADVVPGNANDPLDVALRGIARIAKNHNVTPLNRFPAIDELVNEDTLLIVEGRHHACAFDLHRLIKKNDDEGRDGERDDEISKPDGDGSRSMQRRPAEHRARLVTLLRWLKPHVLHAV